MMFDNLIVAGSRPVPIDPIPTSGMELWIVLATGTFVICACPLLLWLAHRREQAESRDSDA